MPCPKKKDTVFIWKPGDFVFRKKIKRPQTRDENDDKNSKADAS